MSSSIEGVETDFGFVRYSAKTLDYLNRHAPTRNDPRRRGKKREWERLVAQRVAAAVNVCATIEFVSGGVLEVF